MRERLSGNWLQGFNYFTSESEAPDNYLFWAAMSTLAGAVGRKAYFRYKYHPIFTNIYVLLVGPPGNFKSQALMFERPLLKHIKSNIASEALTKEGMIKQMKDREKDGINNLTVVSSDLMTFFRPSQGAMVEFLTDIFDCQEDWEYTTRNRPTDTIPKPYVNFIAGTTPSWIADNFDESFTEQGFAARTLIVQADEPRFRKAEAHITADMFDMYESLKLDLEHISTLAGEFSIDSDAWNWFINWYENILPNQRIDYRLQGYLRRKDLHLWKVAMLISIAEKDDLVINLDTIITAEATLSALEPTMARAYSAVGRNPIAGAMQRILKDIIEAGSLSEAELIRVNSGDLSSAQLSEALENLVAMGDVRIQLDRSTKQLVYHAT